MDALDGLRTRLVIEGGRRLQGVVDVPGAKNAALPIMAASILAEGEVVQVAGVRPDLLKGRSRCHVPGA